ncbi:hypothetical protein GCM10028810_66020 [Spirosoma litoris]
MTKPEKKLISGQRSGQISKREFYEKFPLKEYSDSAQIATKVETVISNDAVTVNSKTTNETGASEFDEASTQVLPIGRNYAGYVNAGWQTR